MDAYYYLFIYLLLINGLAFVLMAFDKRRAKRRGRRVPEQRLFLISALGGAFGTWLGMRAWRHKTNHRSFVVGIPYLIALNLIIVIVLVWLIGLNTSG